MHFQTVGWVLLRFRGSDEIDHLPVVSSIDAEVRTVDSHYLGTRVPLAQDHNRCVSQIHLFVARHEGAEPCPVCRNLQVQPKRVALEQLKQRIDVNPVCAQQVRHLGEDRLRRQHRGTHLLHHRDSPRVIWVVPVEIRYERSRVANRDHVGANLRRSLVAGFRSPATLPARSEVIS